MRPEHIDVETAYERLQSGQAIMIDARARPGERIAGAVSVPAGAEVDALLDLLPRELLWIVYADSEWASDMVAQRARHLGLNRACVLDGGVAAWKRGGHATEAGRDVVQPNG